jgi:hypothetical protein
MYMHSFGVLLCELTGESGIAPFPSAWTNADVKTNVNNGFRLPKAPSCPISIYDMCLRCWSKAPEERPTFITLNKDLQTIGDVLPPAERTVMSTAMANIPTLTATSESGSQASLNPAPGIKMRRRSSNMSEDWNQISVLGKLNRQVCKPVVKQLRLLLRSGSHINISPLTCPLSCRSQLCPSLQLLPLHPRRTNHPTIPWLSPLFKATQPLPKAGSHPPGTLTTRTPTCRMQTSPHGGSLLPQAKPMCQCNTPLWMAVLGSLPAYRARARWKLPSAKACD